jgi:hypothetical protein
MLYQEALYQGTGFSRAGGLGENMGFSPCARRKASAAKALATDALRHGSSRALIQSQPPGFHLRVARPLGGGATAKKAGRPGEDAR